MAHKAPEKAWPRVERLAFTIEEVAEALGVSEKTVDGLIADGGLGSILIGKRGRRVTARQLDDYVAALEKKAGWVPAT